MEDARSRSRLAPEQLRRVTDPATLEFETTASLAAPQRMVGQERAQEAINLALGMPDNHYNLFVSGHPGSGRREAVMLAVEPAAAARPAAQDWCYVHNFDQPEEPRAVALPAGLGRQFARDVAAYVRSCRAEFRRAFNGSAFQQQRERILHTLSEQRDVLLDDVRDHARSLGFALRETQDGIAIVALKPRSTPAASARPIAPDASYFGASEPGEPSEAGAEASGGSTTGAAADGDEPQPYSREEFETLTSQQQTAIREVREQIETILEGALGQVRTRENEARAQLRSISRTVADQAIAATTEPLVARYAVSADAVEFLRRMRADMVAHSLLLRAESDSPAPGDAQAAAGEETPNDDAEDAEGAERLDASQGGEVDGDEDGEEDSNGSGSGDGDERPALLALLRHYRVNVLVTHKPGDHAPIVEELTLSRVNLLGRIEVAVRRGAAYTDHMMIKAGALHRANGGFLIVHARDMMHNSHAWDTIKKTIRFGTIKTEHTPETSGGLSNVTLRPEPILAHIKVIIIGDRVHHAALDEIDAEFGEFFKVRADFDTKMARTKAHEMAYAHYAGRVASDAGGPPLSADAVALVIDEGSRWAADQDHLSAIFGDVHDLTAEACYWARQEMATLTTRAHVVRAIQSREHRTGLYADRYQEAFANGIYAVATEGAVVGQINGLTIERGIDYSVGVPMRITARTGPGLSGITSIERESEMSGPTHTKGVYTLAGYLLGRYGQDGPPSLAASIGLEQEAGGVDGDSASSAELYAILSSLANVPIRQGIAVTGSVNQRGEVQAIGKVTEKVESFFDLCARRGLNGQQGVMIPRSNVRHLMLKEPLIQAVRAGMFHVFAVSTIDEGIEILTGVNAGAPQPGTGEYLSGTLNDRIRQTLRGYAEKVRSLGMAPAYAHRPVQ